jgi:hypothetical protein
VSSAYWPSTFSVNWLSSPVESTLLVGSRWTDAREEAHPAIKVKAAEIIRSHIERITLTPNDQGTLESTCTATSLAVLRGRRGQTPTPRPWWTGA